MLSLGCNSAPYTIYPSTVIHTRIDGVGDGALAIVHDLELFAALVNPDRVGVGVFLRRR